MPAKRAAIYLRMSTDKKEQEDSPERQLSTILPYCQSKGYTPVESYKDEGVSGSKHKERTEFLRLLRDAEDRKFDVIVADKGNRFSRQDEYEFFELVVPRLKRAGVILDTVFDGETNWDDFGGFIKSAVNSYQNSQFLKGLSHEVLSGSISKAKDGRTMGGVPYGYRSQKDNPEEDKCRRHLVIVEEQAAIVRWLFNSYANDDVPMRHQMNQLNAQLIPAPSEQKKSRKPRKHSPKWQPGTIRRILTNRKYTGTGVYGKTARGAFNRMIRGKLTPSKKGDAPIQNPEADWIIVPDAHEAIISRELFDRVQAKLAGNRGKNRKPTGVGGYLFSGMLVCGICGRTLYAKKHGNKIYYQCRKTDFTDCPECGYQTVSEQQIIGRIHLMLQERLFKQETIDKHIAELVKQHEQTRLSVDPKRIEKLQEDIKNAIRRLVFLDDDQIPHAKQVIREKQAELDSLQAQLNSDIDAAELFKQTVEKINRGAKDYQELMDRFRLNDPVIELPDELAAQEAAAGPARQRAALQSWVKKITIHWKRTGKRNSQLLGIVVETQWGDIQTWGELANVYRQVLAKTRRTAIDLAFCRRQISASAGAYFCPAILAKPPVTRRVFATTRRVALGSCPPRAPTDPYLPN